MANCLSVKKLIDATLVPLRPVLTEDADGGRINNTLFKTVPLVNDLLRKKVTSHVQATSGFGSVHDLWFYC